MRNWKVVSGLAVSVAVSAAVYGQQQKGVKAKTDESAEAH